jgi:putative ABC transport system permease protein
MIRHCFKLAWTRKGKNALVVFEILISFLVLFSVVLVSSLLLANYRLPLGFEYDNVWSVIIENGAGASSDSERTSVRERIGQVMLALREFPEVQGVAAASAIPYFGGAVSYSGPDAVGLEASDSFLAVMGLDLLQGRWFRPDDKQLAWVPVVINQKMAHQRFGEESPLGKVVSHSDAKTEARVVGVLKDYRRNGDYSPPENVGFWRMSLEEDLNTSGSPTYLLLKMHPSTTAIFEEELLARLNAVAPDWSFEVNPLAELRETALQNSLVPVIIGALIVGFLLIMVGLGMLGILWQNITGRTKEIGLRRAYGAKATDIWLQLTVEVMATTTLAVGLGCLVVFQVPLFDLIGAFDWTTYAGSVVLSVLIVYFLTGLCTLYPVWLGTRIQPVEALHYE